MKFLTSKLRQKKKHIIKPHVHKKRLTKIYYTSEVILLLKGLLRVDFYNQYKKYLFSKVLKPNDIIMLVSGGHGFKILKDKSSNSSLILFMPILSANGA